MEFIMFVTINRQRYRIQVERFYALKQIERYRLKGGKRILELQTNRPFLVSQNRRKKFKWQLISGTLEFSSTWEIIIDELEHQVIERTKNDVI
jgi:hypothetical protein